MEDPRTLEERAEIWRREYAERVQRRFEAEAKRKGGNRHQRRAVAAGRRKSK